MRNIKKKIDLDKRKVPMGQFGPEDSVGDHELTTKEYNLYAKTIGKFFLVFSDLEDSINHALSDSISDRSHEQGYRIIRYLNFSSKIEILFHDYKSMISICIDRRKQMQKMIDDTEVLFNKTKEISEFRNKIAHAQWGSIDEKKYVITKIINDKDGYVSFEKVKITPGIILKFTRQAQSISNKVSDFRDGIWNKINTQKRRRTFKKKSEKPN